VASHLLMSTLAFDYVFWKQHSQSCDHVRMIETCWSDSEWLFI